MSVWPAAGCRAWRSGCRTSREEPWASRTAWTTSPGRSPTRGTESCYWTSEACTWPARRQKFPGGREQRGQRVRDSEKMYLSLHHAAEEGNLCFLRSLFFGGNTTACCHFNTPNIPSILWYSIEDLNEILLKCERLVRSPLGGGVHSDPEREWNATGSFQRLILFTCLARVITEAKGRVCELGSVNQKPVSEAAGLRASQSGYQVQRRWHSQTGINLLWRPTWIVGSEPSTSSWDQIQLQPQAEDSQ